MTNLTSSYAAHTDIHECIEIKCTQNKVKQLRSILFAYTKKEYIFYWLERYIHLHTINLLVHEKYKIQVYISILIIVFFLLLFFV